MIELGDRLHVAAGWWPVRRGVWLTVGCLFHLVRGISSTAQPSLDAGLVDAGRRYLADHFPAAANRIEVRVLRSNLDDKNGPWRIALPPDDGEPRGHRQAGLETRGEDGTWRAAGWAMFYFAHYDSVAVLRHALRKDDPLAVADLVFAWMETTRFAGEPLTPERFRTMAAEPVFTQRSLGEGDALQAGDVRPAYAASTGEPVEMTYRRDRVVLRLTGQARSAGFVGDTIRLYAATTQTMYRARLTGPGRAEWLETLR